VGNPVQHLYALDLGATSARLAHGVWDGRVLKIRMVRRLAHAPIVSSEGWYWDWSALSQFCDQAREDAEQHDSRRTSLAVDGWGVDVGFLDSKGQLLAPPRCYRDPRHAEAMTLLAPFAKELYDLTGVQCLALNTIFQLQARKQEQATWLDRVERWRMLPELVVEQWGGASGHEWTNASTTGLVGWDGQWCDRAFEIIGWPVPEEEIVRPGELIGRTPSGVGWVRVGSHDTASAVEGLGPFDADEAYLNLGTWALVGRILSQPGPLESARVNNWTHERAVDGRIRFLKNVPGMYLFQRMHEELGLRSTLGEWLSSASSLVTFDSGLNESELFSPPSMLTVVGAGHGPLSSPAEWASRALGVWASLLRRAVQEMVEMTGPVRRLRVGGGGAQIPVVREVIQEAVGCEVVWGSAEATILGNFKVQLQAWDQAMPEEVCWIESSSETARSAD